MKRNLTNHLPPIMSGTITGCDKQLLTLITQTVQSEAVFANVRVTKVLANNNCNTRKIELRFVNQLSNHICPALFCWLLVE